MIDTLSLLLNIMSLRVIQMVMFSSLAFTFRTVFYTMNMPYFTRPIFVGLRDFLGKGGLL